jgi:hypothetical protein
MSHVNVTLPYCWPYCLLSQFNPSAFTSTIVNNHGWQLDWDMKLELPSTLAVPGGMVPRIISGIRKLHIIIKLAGTNVLFSKYASADETSAHGTDGLPCAVSSGTLCPLIRRASCE